MKRIALALSVCLAAPLAMAQGDSSAQGDHFVHSVDSSYGVVLQVEVNELGEENVESVSVRLHRGSWDVENTDDMQYAWDHGTDASGQPELFEEDILADSSTTGWYYQKSKKNQKKYKNKWRKKGYHKDHRPTYYYRGARYTYRNSSYDCNRYTNRAKKRVRYYYYPRYYW